MGYYKAKAEFTRASRAGLIVGNPKHADVRARFLSMDEAIAQPLLNEGLIGKVSRSEYHKGIEGAESDAGEALVDQVGGKRAKVSARMTDEALAEEARIRGVDISKAKDRSEVIKAINAKETSSAPDEVDGTDNAFSRTGRETAESTLHSRRASPQNDVSGNGTVDHAAPGAAVDLEDEEAAPSGGGGSSETK